MKKRILLILILMIIFNINRPSYSKIFKPSTYKESTFRDEYVYERGKTEAFILHAYSDLLGDSKKHVMKLYSGTYSKIVVEKLNNKYSLLDLSDKNGKGSICYILNNKGIVIGYFLPDRLYLGGISNKLNLIKPIQDLEEDTSSLNKLNITVPNNVTIKVYKKIQNGFVENYSLVGRINDNNQKRNGIRYLAWEAFYPIELEETLKKYAETELQEFLNFVSQ
jgi:hypothetical protein